MNIVDLDKAFSDNINSVKYDIQTLKRVGKCLIGLL